MGLLSLRVDNLVMAMYVTIEVTPDTATLNVIIKYKQEAEVLLKKSNRTRKLTK